MNNNSKICIILLVLLIIAVIYFYMSPKKLEHFEVTIDPNATIDPNTTIPTTTTTDAPTSVPMTSTTEMVTTTTMPTEMVTTTTMPTEMVTTTTMPTEMVTTTTMPTSGPSTDSSSFSTNTSSPTIGVTAPPPSLVTPSVQEMGNMGLYTLGKPNINQIGGEGPNNYFQPNIFIKRRNNGDSGNTTNTHRFEIGVGKELEGLIPSIKSAVGGSFNQTNGASTQALFESDTTYGYTHGYEFPTDQPSVSNNSTYGSGSSQSSYSDNYYVDNQQYNLQPATTELFTETSMKQYHPGYQIQPPKCWDVPAKRPPVCLGNNERLPAAVFDRGTPLNALNLDTSVGSIMPKFTYTEQSRS